MADEGETAPGSTAPTVAGSALRKQRMMLVAVLAVGAILPISAVLFSRSTQRDLGPEVGSSIDAFDVLNGQSLVVGPASAQVCSPGIRIDSLDGDDVVVLASAADRAFALTDRGLLVADTQTFDFAPWPPLTTSKPGRLGDDTGARSLLAMGASNGVVYVVSDAGRTWRIDSSTARVLSTSASSVEAPEGRLAVSVDSSPTVWGVSEAGQLLRTDDQGDSWIEVASLGIVYDVATDHTASERVGVLDKAGVLMSNDAGLTWERVDSPPGLEAIVFDAGVLYGATSVEGRCLTFAFVDGKWTVNP